MTFQVTARSRVGEEEQTQKQLRIHDLYSGRGTTSSVFGVPVNEHIFKTMLKTNPHVQHCRARRTAARIVYGARYSRIIADTV